MGYRPRTGPTRTIFSVRSGEPRSEWAPLSAKKSWEKASRRSSPRWTRSEIEGDREGGRHAVNEKNKGACGAEFVVPQRVTGTPPPPPLPCHNNHNSNDSPVCGLAGVQYRTTVPGVHGVYGVDGKQSNASTILPGSLMMNHDSLHVLGSSKRLSKCQP